MFELEVQTEFSAAHAIVINGEREPVHGHNWRVTLWIAGNDLDADGLLCDFHEVERQLAEVIRPFQNTSLNEVAPFDSVNPTAERVAEHIGRTMAERLPAGVRVARTRVTEATGCAAVWIGNPEVS